MKTGNTKEGGKEYREGTKWRQEDKGMQRGGNRRRGAAKEVEDKGKVNSQCWFPDGMLAVTNVAEAAPRASACHASLRPLRRGQPPLVFNHRLALESETVQRLCSVPPRVWRLRCQEGRRGGGGGGDGDEEQVRSVQVTQSEMEEGKEEEHKRAGGGRELCLTALHFGWHATFTRVKQTTTTRAAQTCLSSVMSVLKGPRYTRFHIFIFLNLDCSGAASYN